ncbi:MULTISPECIES: SDR family NAD(P)-dependent oxidoreductase [Mesorhizobium]|uniref:SDR family oxidoreductase n=1 Tax=Mesorhizobium denitrificans TaxID=2294114 RepID=A0A371X8W2_9HYPH|nr:MULTISPECIES: SDR family oxidoreductase [Mesorhizobium]RFC65666.1 SDR family oxidoreductase [Mesorhizobium denitrificans]
MAVALIAGGSSGIGLAVLRAFRERGDDVFLADIDETRSLAAVSERGAGKARSMVCDLSTREGPRQAVEAALAEYGRIDCVFANAAILESAPLQEWKAEQWEKSLALNLSMPFYLTQAAAPILARSDNASIILTASTGALRGHAGMPAYHATKSGLLGLCRALADELAPQGTRVNCLLPGWIDTPFNDSFWRFQADPVEAERALLRQIPMGRQGTPEDVAGTVLFLASPAARYVTGTSLVVDGGYTAV